MDMQKPHRTLAGLAGAGLLVLALAAACTTGSEPEVAGSVRGMLRDECGPADGPAIFVSLDRSKTLTCADPSPGEFKLSVDGRFVDSLRAGQVLEDTTTFCNAAGCTPATYYRIEVESVSADRIQGTMEVSETVDGALVKKRYRAELEKCPRPAYLCG